MKLVPNEVNLRLKPRQYYEIFRARDARYDGRIYIAVSSTGIYCRPICGARLPRFQNCSFYPLPAVAEKHGYRPCLLCRPELAPGDNGQSLHYSQQYQLVKKILRRIEDGGLNNRGVDELAAEFEISGRYLRKITQQELGVTPSELAQTQRLLQAKRLITDTTLAVTDVAFAAGFGSIRHFNHEFKKRYRLAPSHFRQKPPLKKAKRKHQTSADHFQEFRLDYRPPLNWDALLGFLVGRAIPGVECVIDGRYLRTVLIDEYRGWIAVEPARSSGAKTRYSLKVSISDGLIPVAIEVLNKLINVFDIRANTADIETHLGRDPLLAATVRGHSGMRLPGAFDGFELLLRAILGQQISVKGATTLAGRFAKTFGQKITTPHPALSFSTPSAAKLANAKVDKIQSMGLPYKRAETIRLAAQAVTNGELTLHPGADPALTAKTLIAIPGIGEWTADYVAMRALNWPDAFPSGDLGVKKAMKLSHRKAILARAERWRPWRAYATMYLWLSLAGG